MELMNNRAGARNITQRVEGQSAGAYGYKKAFTLSEMGVFGGFKAEKSYDLTYILKAPLWFLRQQKEGDQFEGYCSNHNF